MRNAFLASTIFVSLLSGCSISSLDDDVLASVAAASIEVTAAPNDLANVRIDVRLKAGSRADRTLVLESASIREPLSGSEQKTLAALDLQFPSSFSGRVRDDEVKIVPLENVGTTNAALAPFCGTDVIVSVKMKYENDPSVTIGADIMIRPTCTK